MEDLGYEYRPGSFVTSREHLFFRKVRNRKRTHHLHVVDMDTAEFQEYLWFRDFLVANPEAAQRYAAFKLELAAECADDRNRYVKTKTEFVAQLMDEVRAWAASAGGQPNVRRDLPEDTLMPRSLRTASSLPDRRRH